MDDHVGATLSAEQHPDRGPDVLLFEVYNTSGELLLQCGIKKSYFHTIAQRFPLDEGTPE